jgi:hypothetical protein
MDFLGDATRTKEIVEFNNLVYPYLSTDPSDHFLTYAHGYVRVERHASLSTGALTIRKHWAFHTKPDIMGYTIKTFRVIDDVTLNAGQTVAYIPVRSIVSGIKGNASPMSVTTIGEDFKDNAISFISVGNEAPITGGSEGFVKVTGEYLQIPNDEDLADLANFGRQFSIVQTNHFYGEDMRMENYDLVINKLGDIDTVAFVDNVSQAVGHRITGEKGDIALYFDFGTNIGSIIGDGSIPLEAKEKLIRIELLEQLQSDDRIEQPEILNVTFATGEEAVYVDLKVRVTRFEGEVTFENVLIGGN